MTTNENKLGYKKTKIGWIPEEWEISRINNVTEYVDYRGKTPPKKENGVFLVTAKNIKDGYIDYKSSLEYVSKDDYDRIMSRGKPKLGDVLITTEAPMGNVAQIDNENIALAQRVIKYRSSIENLDNNYLKWFFLSPYFRKELDLESSGSTVKGIKGSRLHKIPIILPPLKEQKKIAQILSTWDEAIAKQQQLIDRLKARKKGLMQQLLTGSLRLRDASGEVFSGEWKEVKLGDVFEEIKDKNDGGKHEPLTISAKIGFVSQREKFDRVIAGGSLDKYTLIKKGEFSYNKGNSKTYPMGCIFLLEDYDSAVIPFVYISFRSKCEIADRFYKQWFSNHGLDRQLKAIITSGARGDGLLNVNKNDFFSLKIPFPPLEEQQAIAKVLTTADKEIALHERRLSELQAQKRGLMQQLLTGQKRVELN